MGPMRSNSPLTREEEERRERLARRDCLRATPPRPRPSHRDESGSSFDDVVRAWEDALEMLGNDGG